MGSLRRISTSALLAGSLLASSIVCGYAHALESGDYLSTANEFETLAEKTRQSGRMPRISDSATARLVAVLSDKKRFLDGPEFSAEDLGDLMNMCARSNEVVMSYVLFDVQRGIAEADMKNSPTATNGHVNRVIRENGKRFEQELSRLQPFLLHCVARQVPLINQFIQGLAPQRMTNMRRAGFTRTRQGIFTTYFGFLQMAGNRESGQEYRQALSHALAETATAYAAVVRPLDRKRVIDFVGSLQSARSEQRPEWHTTVIAAMTKPTCIGLCKF